MADGRMLKKKISLSRRLAALETDSARMLYTWLNSHLDVEGRFSADPEVVKGQVVPRLKHLTPEVVEELLCDIASQGLIVRYENDGDRFLELRRFKDEQKLRPGREKKSEIPAPKGCKLLDEARQPPGNRRATAGSPPADKKGKQVEGLDALPDSRQEEAGRTPAQVKLREVKIREDNVECIEFRLSEYLLRLIKERNENFKQPNLEKWAEIIDLMIRIDKRDPEEIKEVIEWCQQDDFWQDNILSASKLRKQYDQLVMKMPNSKPQKRKGGCRNKDCMTHNSPSGVYINDDGLCITCATSGKHFE